jgi:hypothetical protein
VKVRIGVRVEDLGGNILRGLMIGVKKVDVSNGLVSRGSGLGLADFGTCTRQEKG